MVYWRWDKGEIPAMKYEWNYAPTCKAWKHKWIIKEKEILPSLLEQFHGGEAEYPARIDPSHKSCIVTYVCYKCGSDKVERI